jgi:pyruvate, water dikinase
MLIKNLFKHLTYQVFLPGTLLRKKFEAFKSLLEHDKCAHETMSELEEIYHRQKVVDFTVIQKKYDQFSGCVADILDNLFKLSPSQYLSLKDYYKKFDFYIRFMLAPPDYRFSPPFTYPLEIVTPDDAELVGGKALNIALAATGLTLPVPPGFVVTTNAFYYFLEYNDLNPSIREVLAEIDIDDPASLNIASQRLSRLISTAELPPTVRDAIFKAFENMARQRGKAIPVAVRSSAAGEDSEISFAGQYETVLNVDKAGLAQAVKTVFASKYSPNALFYRISYGLSDIEVSMAVIILEMIDAEASGVCYTRDIFDPIADRMTIHATRGLGDGLVAGGISSDRITVSRTDPPEIIDKQAATAPAHEQGLSVDDASVLELAQWAMGLEDLFQTPQDIEWCKDAEGNLFLLQSRPLKNNPVLPESGPVCEFDAVEQDILLSGGETAASGIGAGTVFRINRESDIDNLPAGSVLVAKNASPHYVKVMNRLKAVVTDSGSVAGHFSSVAREFGVPALVNTTSATRDLKTGQTVTVWADGQTVYSGIVAEMTESPCAQQRILSDSPYVRKIRYVMNFISPLRLTDPQAPIFSPEGCRSLHDIIRFAHEKAVQEMFSIGDKRFSRKKGALRLDSTLPMVTYVLDVGGGIRADRTYPKSVPVEDLNSIPMKALWKGLMHPGIRWGDFTHFNWAEYDRIVMAGGIIGAESPMLSSYAVLSKEYMNFSLKFGYHFVILDSLCGVQPEDNYILFRFSGGGGDMEGRYMRAEFIAGILDRLGFAVDVKGDLIDAQFKNGDPSLVEGTLDMVGRLLGATRLMDMYLKDNANVGLLIEDFINGRYHFAAADDDPA